MLRIFSFAAFTAGTLLGASAAPNYAICFEREYDAAHLRQHKLQEITRMRFRLRDDMTGDIAAGFRELRDYQASEIKCVGKAEDSLDCDILADGGSFTVATKQNGILITNTSQMRFGPEETGISFQREAEHLKFLLRPAACP